MVQATPKQQETIARYKAFWNREPVDRPLITFGQPYPAKHLEMSRKLQEQSGPISLEQMNPEAFLPSYEALFTFRSQLPSDAFYTPVPANGFPWMEAMAGCEVVASGQGFSALHYVKDFDELEKIPLSLESPWCQKYFSFLDVLGAHFKDRTGVGQPIFRGISDLLSALMGPEQIVFCLYDEPERMKAFVKRVTAFYVEIYKEQMRRIPPFLGGYQIGFYDIWAPEPCLWLQDDNLVLFSPEMYEEFFLEFVSTITALTPYNLIHLHPVCFHNLDGLLSVDTLRVLEVNREMTETSFSEQLPVLKKIQQTKLLDVQGTFSLEDLELTLNTLSHSGLQLKCLFESVDDIPRLHETFLKAVGK